MSPQQNAQFMLSLRAAGLPAPIDEFRFAAPRRWRFDFAWPEYNLALEIQGGIWIGGRHSRGATLVKEWEKLNTAAELGWRVVYCQPKDSAKPETIAMIKRALWEGL